MTADLPYITDRDWLVSWLQHTGADFTNLSTELVYSLYANEVQPNPELVAMFQEMVAAVDTSNELKYSRFKLLLGKGLPLIPEELSYSLEALLAYWDASPVEGSWARFPNFMHSQLRGLLSHGFFGQSIAFETMAAMAGAYGMQELAAQFRAQPLAKQQWFGTALFGGSIVRP